jgi:hypothetical protein
MSITDILARSDLVLGLMALVTLAAFVTVLALLICDRTEW